MEYVFSNCAVGRHKVVEFPKYMNKSSKPKRSVLKFWKTCMTDVRQPNHEQFDFGEILKLGLENFKAILPI